MVHSVALAGSAVPSQPVIIAMRDLTAARRSVMRTHASVHPRGVAWTSDLCAYRTWRWLYDNGILKGGKLTELGLLCMDRFDANAAAYARRREADSLKAGLAGHEPKANEQ